MTVDKLCVGPKDEERQAGRRRLGKKPFPRHELDYGMKDDEPNAQ